MSRAMSLKILSLREGDRSLTGSLCLATAGMGQIVASAKLEITQHDGSFVFCDYLSLVQLAMNTAELC